MAEGDDLGAIKKPTKLAKQFVQANAFESVGCEFLDEHKQEGDWCQTNVAPVDPSFGSGWGQYCAGEYQQVLENNGIIPSMTDGYDCYQNALAERLNGILKQEFLHYRCKIFAELKSLVRQSVNIYNYLRSGLSLGMKTPEEVYEKASSLWGLA